MVDSETPPARSRTCLGRNPFILLNPKNPAV
jgi:hypothetical protein